MGSSPTGGSSNSNRTTLWLARFFLLWACLSFNILSGQELSHEETFSLAKKLEEKGFLLSAKSYYERLQRDTQIDPKLLLLLEKRIQGVNQALDIKYEAKGLPELDGFENFSLAPSTSEALQQAPSKTPDQFPATTINKKKWIIGTIIVVAIAAYIIIDKANEEDPVQPSPTGSINITF